MLSHAGVYRHGSPGSQPRKEVGSGGERLGALGGILGISSGRGQVWVEEGIKLGCVSADLRVL